MVTPCTRARYRARRGMPPDLPPDLECVILVGLPAAGKTKLYRERFAKTHLHVSKDLWPKATARDARQRKMIDEALATLGS